MNFLLSASEWVTTQVDMITGVIQNNWATILAIFTSPVIISQIWGTIRTAIVSKKTALSNLRMVHKIEEASAKTIEASNKLSENITNAINSGFDSIALKNEKLEAKKKEIQQKAIAKIIAGNSKTTLKIQNATELLKETAEEVEAEAVEVIDEVVEVAEEVVEQVIEKVEEAEPIKTDVVKVIKRVVKR